MSGLVFHKDEHRYFYDGAEVPGVTKVLKLAGITNDRFYDEWSRDRGTAVHAACELWDKGELDEESLDPRIQPYLDGWKAFSRDMSPIWASVERKMYHPIDRYAGTIDRFGDIPTMTGMTVVDIKSGAPQRADAIQTAAYSRMAKIERRAAVYLSDDGRYKIETFQVENLRHDYDIFRSALNLLRWKGEIP